MQRICGLFLSLCLVLGLCACGGQKETAPTWQEQYDLGIRYLSEGNYEEAIIAFTAAIEIEPKQAKSYIGLADAYLGLDRLDDAKEILDEALSIVNDTDMIAEKQSALEETLSAFLNDNKTNSYGATEFKYREHYVDFEQCTDQEKQFIQSVVAAATAEDIAALQALVGFPFGEAWHSGNYTMYDGYKINITSTGGRLQIELRPENGTGYYYDIWRRVEPDNRFPDRNNERLYIIHSSCLCADWQWNGQLAQIIEQREISVLATRYGEYAGTGTSTYITKIDGVMVDNLRDGIFTSQKSSTQVWGEDAPIIKTNDPVVEIYQKGMLADDDDTLFSIHDYGHGGTLEDQGLIDQLFW